MARPAQITQNNKFAKSLQYLKKEVRDEVEFFVKMSIIVIYKVLLTFLMDVTRHAKTLEILSTQCLCNISRKLS